MQRRKFFMVLTAILILGVMLGNYSAGASERTNWENLVKGETIRVAFCKFPQIISWEKFARKKVAELGGKMDAAWYSWDAMNNKIMMDYRAGMTTWDLFYGDGKDLPTYIALGAMTPIERYINDPTIAAPDLDLEDFVPALIQVATSDGFWGPKGVLWTLPVSFQPNGLIYRKDLFNHPAEKKAFKQKYGYELTVPETYDQFYDVAEFFTRKKGEMLTGEVLKIDFYGTSNSCKGGGFIYHDYMSYALGFGIDNIYDPETMMPSWNSAENIAAGKFFVSLRPFMPPGVEGMTSGESLGLFGEGRVAMVVETMHKVGPALDDPARSKVMEKWDYTINPSQPGTGRKGAAQSNIAAPVIYSLSRNKEVDYKLIEYVTSKEIQKRRAIEDNLPPVRISVMKDPEVLAKRPWMKKLPLLAAPDIALYPDVMNPHFSKILDIVAISISEAFIGEKSVEEAFNEAQQELVALFKEVGYLK